MASLALTFDLRSKRIGSRSVPATVAATATTVGYAASGAATVLGRSSSVGAVPLVGLSFASASASGAGISFATAAGSAAGSATAVSPGFVVQNPIAGLEAFWDSGTLVPGEATVSLFLNTNGTWLVTSVPSGDLGSGNWGDPTTVGKGADYWVQFTRTVNGGGSSSPSTGWLQLSSQRGVSVAVTGGGVGLSDATYTVALSTSASGTPVVSTTTGVRLYALVEI